MEAHVPVAIARYQQRGILLKDDGWNAMLELESVLAALWVIGELVTFLRPLAMASPVQPESL